MPPPPAPSLNPTAASSGLQQQQQVPAGPFLSAWGTNLVLDGRLWSRSTASSAATEELPAVYAVYDPPHCYQEEESASHLQRLDQVIAAPVTAEATFVNHMDVPVPIERARVHFEETDWHLVEPTPGVPPPPPGDPPPVPADVPVVPMSPDVRSATVDSYEEHDATDVSLLGVPGDPTV